MRAGQLFHYLMDYDFDKAQDLASRPFMKGGWEVWFQVEFAAFMKQNDARFQMEREVTYPGSPNRCDFLIWYGDADYHRGEDLTYIELKCINQMNRNPRQSALADYRKDLTKVVPPNLLVG